MNGSNEQKPGRCFASPLMCYDHRAHNDVALAVKRYDIQIVAEEHKGSPKQIGNQHISLIPPQANWLCAGDESTAFHAWLMSINSSRKYVSPATFGVADSAMHMLDSSSANNDRPAFCIQQDPG